MIGLPHRRHNPLTGDWVLVSPQRMQRPWQGDRADSSEHPAIDHDPACYLCPGNQRTGGATNPDYDGPFVFHNDFPALLDQTSVPGSSGLLRSAPARGEARVLCYSPDHSATLARMSDAERCRVIDAWSSLSAELGQRWDWVQIFENKGAMMGASSPHPHGQVWAGDFLPTLVAREDGCQRAHFRSGGMDLLGQVVDEELAAQERIVVANDHWIVLVPYWAAWPFETLLVPRTPVRRLEHLVDCQRTALAHILGRLLGGYDALFATDFPYSMGWHGAPHALRDDCDHWRLHAHFHPPLLRSATIRKHMVGYELLAETQRDLTPEMAAARLREVVA